MSLPGEARRRRCRTRRCRHVCLADFRGQFLIRLLHARSSVGAMTTLHAAAVRKMLPHTSVRALRRQYPHGCHSSAGGPARSLRPQGPRCTASPLSSPSRSPHCFSQNEGGAKPLHWPVCGRMRAPSVLPAAHRSSAWPTAPIGLGKCTSSVAFAAARAKEARAYVRIGLPAIVHDRTPV